MDAFRVTLEEFNARLKKPVPEEDEGRVSLLLSEAGAVVLSDPAFVPRENDDAQIAAFRMCVCSMVERRLESESGSSGWSTQTSVTTGPFSQSVTRQAPMAGMSLLPSERRLLGMDDCMVGYIVPGGGA